MKQVLVALAVLATLLVLTDLYLALLWSPPEAEMGDLVRIMYFHVASAWVAFLAFTVTFVCSLLYFWRRNAVIDLIALSSTEISLVYTTITLVTGSLWARPVWNTWWTWDPRLTTTLILWFLLIGLLLLRGTVTGAERRARFSAVFAIVAFVDVPIIHLSVTLWRSIHPQVITDTGFQMPGSMVITLLFSFLAFMVIYALLLLLRVQAGLLEIRIQKLRGHIRDVTRVMEGEVQG